MNENHEFEWQALDWSPGNTARTLNSLADYVRLQAEEDKKYYMDKSPPKKIGAKRLRVAAILALAIAGAVPLLSEITEVESQPWLSPLWSSVAFVLAGTLILLDRFYGYSSAWSRFMMAFLKLETEIEFFNVDWQTVRSTWKDGNPTSEQIEAALKRIRLFVMTTRQIVTEETNEWRVEFTGVLSEIERSARARQAATGNANGDSSNA